MSNVVVQRAVRRALWAAVAVASVSAAAEPEMEEVIVTGSRITRTDTEANSPITIVSEEFFDQKGTVNVEEVLNQLPQVVPGLGSQVNNGGDGTATVDLRGLGPTRTLVLINGRRFVPATNTGRTDLNAIPAQLVERVDVVTGGASAVYGSDALAGVVNFILKDDYEGVEVGARYGETERNDGRQKDIYVLLGGNFAEGRGNATIAVTGYEREALFQSAREFASIDMQGFGSLTGITGAIDNVALNPFGAFAGSPAGSTYAFNSNRTIRRFNNNLPELNGGVGDRYNFSPTNYLVTPQKRYTLNGFARYDVTDSVTAYMETYYISSRSAINLAPTPATGLVLPLSNPLLGADVLALAATRVDNPATAIDERTAPLLFRRRMVEFGPRFNDQNFNTSQVIAGVKGDVHLGDWKYDVYYSFGRTENTAGVRGDISRSKLNASLAGCPAGAGTIPGCRIVDFFGPGKISAQDVEFLRISSALDSFKFDRSLVQANLVGSLATLPAGSLDAAIGVEYRKDASAFVPSDAAMRGDFSGFNSVQPVNGGFEVKEMYAEVRIPFVSNVAGIDYFGAGLKGRVSDYTTVGKLNTYSGDLEYRPIEQLKFRGSYSKSWRAPSVFELFEAGDQSFPSATDPCALIRPNGLPQTVSPSTQTRCIFSGLPAGTISAQANSQVEARLFGNPTLEEEQGTSYTAGIVWTPDFGFDFSTTLDYYDIRVEGYVGRAFGGAATQIAACFSNTSITTLAQYNADAACSRISRTAAGELVISQPYVNASELATSGYDLAVNIGFPLPGGSKMTLRYDLGYLTSFTFDGDEYVEQTSSNFGTLPKLRGNLRAVFDWHSFQTSINWNHLASVEERPGDGGDTVIPSWDYFDLGLRYRFGEKYTIGMTVTNVLDKGAPLILTGYTNTNTDNASFDLLGRRFAVSASAKF